MDSQEERERKRYRLRNIMEILVGLIGGGAGGLVAAGGVVLGHAQARKAYRAALDVARGQKKRRRETSHRDDPT
jgi:hypothetical protein